MLDLKIGRSNKLAEFARADLINYQKIKKFILKQMYVCSFLSKSEDSKMLTQSILQELLRGTDNTQLNTQEISKIPFEYIRQACFLPTPEADEDYGEEAINEQNNLLHRTYMSKQAERYEQLLKLYVGQIKSGHTKITILRRQHKLMKESGVSRSVEELDQSTREERLTEGQTIMNMIDYGGVVPERENLPYYLISIRWFTRWQKYTGCFHVEDDDDEDDDQGMQTTKDSSKIILGEYPGEINSDREMRDLCSKVDEKTIAPEEDFYCHYYLKAGKKENQDYRVVD